MKIIFGSRRHNYLTRIGIFLIAIALIVGTVSCEGDGNGNGEVKYSLTMAANPAAGGTATDLTGGSPYTAGTVVSIQAAANPGYSFVSWSAPAGQFANTVAATTTFTMPAQNVIVTANFALTPTGPLDHFKWYYADDAMGLSINETVYLEDQFGAFNATVVDAGGFGNPAVKWHEGNVTPILNPDHHLTGYYIDYDGEPQTYQVEVKNQFGLQNLTVEGPMGLLLPTQKEGHQQPVNLDHYLLYEVTEGESVYEVVSLQDQFDDGPQESFVDWPLYFANPVQKTYKGNVTDILYPETHLVFYAINASFYGQVEIVNQFGEQTLDVYTFFEFGAIAVPSEKIEWHQEFEFNHSLGYAILGEKQYIVENVTLEDRFGAFNATVMYPFAFGNPVEKWHDWEETPISDPDYHRIGYNLSCEGEHQEWLVVLENQFGIQELIVSGVPRTLVTPAQKVAPFYHDPPVGIDHVSGYEIIAGEAVNQTVDLSDEFGYFTEYLVGAPSGFGNPVRKIHDGNVTEILNPDMCEVTYFLEPWGPNVTQVTVDDQFGGHTFDLYGPIALSVPSRLLYYAPTTNHAVAYYAWNGSQYIGEDVTLEDRFGAFNATVEYAFGFANPVEKWHDGVVAPILDPDYHYLGNNITLEGEPGEWLVMVENQFGIQNLTVSGPTTLSTPAQKLEPYYHDAPVGADHILGYHSIAGEPVNQTVDLHDEFGDFTDVLVTNPTGIGNPVFKIHDGNVTEILNPDMCWVYYNLSLAYSPFYVKAVDQFGNQTLDLWGPLILSVPSQILYYERIS
jgi:hypothetical protein